jgi:Flp pilus assembly CpaE family ATPase
VFQALLISANELRRQALKQLAVAARLVALREYAHYPDSIEEAEVRRLGSPDLVVVDAFDPAAARRVGHRFRQMWPQCGLLLLGAAPVDDGLRAATIARMTPSVDEFESGIRAAIWGAAGLPSGRPAGQRVAAFLPAKAGSGASTITIQVAAVLTAAGKRVAVIDCDWRSGCLYSQVSAEPRGTMRTALEAVCEHDRFGLERSLTPVPEIGDIIFSGPAPPERMPDWSEYHHLFNELEARYDLVLADLPEVVNPATAEVVRRAARIFVVATPELASLQLIDRRWKELDAYGAAAQAEVLINRWQKHPMSWEQLIECIEKPVAGSIPNDYAAVYRSMVQGKPVAPSSKLGRAYASVAARIQAAPGLPVPASSPSWLPRLQQLLGA